MPVIASGGAGELEHLVEALRAGADAALCASIFHYGRYTIAEAKAHLAAAGIPVRDRLRPARACAEVVSERARARQLRDEPAARRCSSACASCPAGASCSSSPQDARTSS